MKTNSRKKTIATNEQTDNQYFITTLFGHNISSNVNKSVFLSFPT